MKKLCLITAIVTCVVGYTARRNQSVRNEVAPVATPAAVAMEEKSASPVEAGPKTTEEKLEALGFSTKGGHKLILQ